MECMLCMMNGELQECQLSLHHLSMVHFAVSLEMLGDLKKPKSAYDQYYRSAKTFLCFGPFL